MQDLMKLGMDMWRNLSQELNFNVMFSPRGIINLAHSDAQMNAIRKERKFHEIKWNRCSSY